MQRPSPPTRCQGALVDPPEPLANGTGGLVLAAEVRPLSQLDDQHCIGSLSLLLRNPTLEAPGGTDMPSTAVHAFVDLEGPAVPSARSASLNLSGTGGAE
jgi:hypothetical protein